MMHHIKFLPLAVSALALAACGQSQQSSSAQSTSDTAAQSAAQAVGADQTQTDTTTSESTADDPGVRYAGALADRLVGRDFPDLAFATLDGKSVSPAAAERDRPVYLKIWATWCTTCLAQMPHFNETAATYGERMDVIAVATGFNETEDDVRRYADKNDMISLIGIDNGELADAIQFNVTPLHIIVGRDGKIQYVGHLADAKLERALNKALTSDREPPAMDQALEKVELATKNRFLPAAPNQHTLVAFVTPWCEDYLAESQPARAKSCKDVRQTLDKVAQMPGLQTVGVASSIWAEEGDVVAYRQANNITYPISYDEAGVVFTEFGIRQTPAIVLLDHEGKQLFATQDMIGNTDWHNTLLEVLNAKS